MFPFEQQKLGLKVHLIVTALGVFVSFIISPACEHDLTALKIMEMPLAPGVKTYGDKAYTGDGFEEELQEKRGITLVAQRKKNSKRPHPEHVEMSAMLGRRQLSKKTIWFDIHWKIGF